MVETFEIMNRNYPKNNDFGSVYKDGWDSKTKEDATSYLNAITKFEFLIGLVSLYRLLHMLVGITQNLQGRSIDIIKAYNEVEGCIQDMQHMRQTIDEEFHKIYKQTERLAEKLHVEPTIPRSAVKEMHRNNVPAENPEEYYRRALAIPLVDLFIAEMTFRFDLFNETVSKLMLLVRSIICDPEYNDLDTEGLIEQYSDDLPNPDVIDLELKLWKTKWSEVEKEDRPASLAKAIKHCDKLKFPNVFTFIKLGCTLPVPSAECERSFSAMRRLMIKIYNEIRSPQFIGDNE